MTEQEARSLFRSLAKPAEGSPISTICMYESEAIAFAKAYAAKKVYTETAKLQGLLTDYYSIIIERNTTINNLEAENLRLMDQVTQLEVVRDENLSEIKALTELIQLKETFDPSGYHKDLIRGYKTEIKRLRDGIEASVFVYPTRKHELLSPAPSPFSRKGTEQEFMCPDCYGSAQGMGHAVCSGKCETLSPSPVTSTECHHREYLSHDGADCLTCAMISPSPVTNDPNIALFHRFFGDGVYTNEEKVIAILSHNSLSRTEAARAIMHIFEAAPVMEGPTQFEQLWNAFNPGEKI